MMCNYVVWLGYWHRDWYDGRQYIWNVLSVRCAHLTAFVSLTYATASRWARVTAKSIFVRKTVFPEVHLSFQKFSPISADIRVQSPYHRYIYRDIRALAQIRRFFRRLSLYFVKYLLTFLSISGILALFSSILHFSLYYFQIFPFVELPHDIEWKK